MVRDVAGSSPVGRPQWAYPMSSSELGGSTAQPEVIPNLPVVPRAGGAKACRLANGSLAQLAEQRTLNP